MPTRHAKNATALGHFTRNEKMKMKKQWGTQTLRLSSENLRHWDACGLCQKLPKEPVVCPNGDIFCKLCIYESLIVQKQDIKAKHMKKEQHDKKKEAEEQQKEQEELLKKIVDFHKLETGAMVTMKKKQARNSVQLEKDDWGNRITAERRTVAQDVDEQDRKLNNFWLPSLAPSAEKRVSRVVDNNTYCPCCNKKLRKKKLKPIVFEPVRIKNKTTNEFTYVTPRDSGEPNYVCCCCRKTFTDTHKKYHIRSCGHVVCRKCVANVMTNDKMCPKCSKPFRKKDLILLKGGGTGYADSGNKVVSKRSAIAWQ